MPINQLILNIPNTFQNTNLKYTTKAAMSVFVNIPTRANRKLKTTHQNRARLSDNYSVK